jgi:hypothetical protein
MSLVALAASLIILTLCRWTHVYKLIRPTSTCTKRFFYFVRFSLTLLYRFKTLVWMAALLRVMCFLLQSSMHTVKRCPVCHCNTSVPCRCLHACFVIFPTVDSSIATSHPILELLWSCSYYSVTSNFCSNVVVSLFYVAFVFLSKGTFLLSVLLRAVLKTIRTNHKH